jgi:hypothetical protein
MTAAAQSGEIACRMSLDHRLSLTRAPLPGSARTVQDCQLCASGISVQPSSASSSPPSNGSLNCTGSLYGTPSANGLGGWGLGTLATSRSIGKPLADDALDGAFGTLFVVNAECGAVVVPEIKLSEISMKMLFADMLIDAIDAALQDRKEVLGGIGGGVPANVFVRRMVDGAMASEPFTNFPIDAAFISAQVRRFVDPGFKDRTQVGGIHLWHMARTDLPVAFNQRYNRLFRSRRFVSAVSGPSPDESLVSFNKHALAAERAETPFTHRLADTVSNEPTCFEIDAEDAAELICAKSLLGRAHKMHRLEPDVHRNVALFEDGADLDGEGLAAGIAFVDADAGGLSVQRSRLFDNAAMRADPTIRPDNLLDVCVSDFLIAEAGMVENGLRHRLSPSRRIYNA